MKKILVPIDFSANSKKALRFAIQLASQSDAEVIFYHVVSMMAPTADAAWDYAYYVQFQQDLYHKRQEDLIKLIGKVYDNSLPPGVRYTCVCKLENDINTSIISFAKKQKVDFICAGARGTGFVVKLFGTVATHLITHSPIPVIIIPKNYRLKPISDICYASDMEHPDTEIKKVLNLAASLKATVKLLHFDYETGLVQNQNRLIATSEKYARKDIKFLFKKMDALYPVNDHLERAISQMKPSLVVLFTKQDRNWYDRLVLSSKSAQLSFTSKVPLLIYRKRRSNH
jgi:nucleotide-binding universal stress UspA family protein